jgi:hypothetical protein
MRPNSQHHLILTPFPVYEAAASDDNHIINLKIFRIYWSAFSKMADTFFSYAVLPTIPWPTELEALLNY